MQADCRPRIAPAGAQATFRASLSSICLFVAGSLGFNRRVPTLMKTVLLGQSALTSTRLAYGCWRIAGPGEPTEASGDREAHGQASVIAAYEAGYTLFDHADIYAAGVAERIFGQALKEVSGMRERVLIADKCGIRSAGAPDAQAPYRYDSTAKHILWSCEQSLKRLGAERIDIYQIHRPDWLGNPEEIAAAFSQLKQAGKVREFGVSNYRPTQLAALQKACPMPLIVNQVAISLGKLDCFNDGTLDQCVMEKITPLAWSPLGGGSLVNPGPIDLREQDHAHRLHVREVLTGIARAHGCSRTAIALAWLLKHPARIVPIVGATNPDHIRDAVTADELDLTREEWYRLLEAACGQRLP
jgi:predicted oxidoreductase